MILAILVALCVLPLGFMLGVYAERHHPASKGGFTD